MKCEIGCEGDAMSREMRKKEKREKKEDMRKGRRRLSENADWSERKDGVVINLPFFNSFKEEGLF